VRGYAQKSNTKHSHNTNTCKLMKINSFYPFTTTIYYISHHPFHLVSIQQQYKVALLLPVVVHQIESASHLLRYSSPSTFISS